MADASSSPGKRARLGLGRAIIDEAGVQASADAAIELKDGSRPVTARAAEGEERERLWARWRELGVRSGESLMADIDEYAARLSREMAVVVLEPRPDGGP